MGLENLALEHMPDVVTTKLEDAVNWARKHSLFQYPYVTACCGMEYMATACGRYDLARFGAEIPRFSPRQADLMWVVGTINHKLAPYLRRIYEQLAEPKWVIAFGVCASTGGFYDNYATVQGIDKIIPVDVYIPGCPPRPEQVLDGLIALQKKIEQEPWRKYSYPKEETDTVDDGDPLFRRIS
jgi:NADH-quinone oxidoreductase subunit B